MNNKNLQAGFIPFLVIAIIAIIAIGGGVYIAKKNKEAKVDVNGNLETQANSNADANANVNANLGINSNGNTKGSLRALLGLGKDTMCTFTTTSEGVNSSGTVYISAAGAMRGDFTSQTTAGTKTSGMIVKDGTSYSWSGTQGLKMAIKPTGRAEANANANTQSKVDLDSQLDYKCNDWTADQSKFTLPTGINFVDIDALLKVKTNL